MQTISESNVSSHTMVNGSNAKLPGGMTGDRDKNPVSNRHDIAAIQQNLTIAERRSLSVAKEYKPCYALRLGEGAFKRSSACIPR